MATKASPADQTVKMPRYLQLAGTLRESILAGDFEEGAQFPTENTLCREFEVSRFTVREALRRLEAEGLIQRKRGSGTTVQRAQTPDGALHQPFSKVSEILQYARGSAIIYDSDGVTQLPADVAKDIPSDVSGKWHAFSGVRQQGYGEKPLAAATGYIHDRLQDVIQKLDFNASSKPLFRQMEQLTGIRASKVTQDIQAIAADEHIADLLEVDPGSPVLRVLRCFMDADDQIFEISVTLHPGERFAYSMMIDVDN